VGGGRLDEIHEEFKPQLDTFNDGFKPWLDGLNEDDLRKDALISKVKQITKDLGEWNRHLGDDGAWAAKINAVINRRSK
jgi:hypothetical protein